VKFHHIGFLSEDVERDMAAFDLLFGKMAWSARFEDPEQDVIARFGRTAEGLVYELVQPRSDKSPVVRSLKARQNIINHLCYRCEDLAETTAELRSQGAVPIGAPRRGVAFSGRLIQFFYMANGMLLEIVEGHEGPFA
jgi:methylmalonyl-CoA/ethylmalonyl-CoA epimerase